MLKKRKQFLEMLAQDKDEIDEDKKILRSKPVDSMVKGMKHYLSHKLSDSDIKFIFNHVILRNDLASMVGTISHFAYWCVFGKVQTQEENIQEDEIHIFVLERLFT